MDSPTRAIVEFARTTDIATIQPRAVHAIVRNLVDTVGCVAAGFDEETSTIARRMAGTTAGTPSASAFGVPDPVLAEFAVFANAASVSYGEFHDDEITRPPRSRIAPSLVALAEANGSDAQELIAAVFVSYHVIMALGDDAPLHTTGHGQSLHLSIAIAAAAGKLLGLTDDQLASAIAIAVTPSIPLSFAEQQPSADWSAIAAAHASMTAVLAVRLAQAGMTGPPNVFDGAGGVWDTVTGPFDFTDISRLHEGTLSVPERIAHRSFPAFRLGQGIIRMALTLRSELTVDEIKSVTIGVTDRTWRMGGGGESDAAEKWNPRTREAAYYSLPYLIARALSDGVMTLDSLEIDRVRDPRLRPLMQKITVVENPEFTKSPAGEKASVEIELAGGGRLFAEQIYPRGHAKNPLSDDELTEKFDASVTKVLVPHDHEELRDRLWNLPDEKDLGAVTALFRRFESSTRTTRRIPS